MMIVAEKVFQGIQRNESGGVWTLPADLPYFEGHFPGNPIFPAVAIVDASLFVLRGMLQKQSLYVRHFPVAKFLSPIQPGQTVRIELKELKPNDWQAEWKDESQFKLLATLRFQL